MKNAFLSLLLCMSVVAFFSFSNGKAKLITDAAEYAEDQDADEFIPDTVPVKKENRKPASKTVPYDSFGKPKKMDSAKSR